ncbi:hypothetical protein Bbelb_007660 [Branchiostoma belcheri]|nr:hypothetical protein Bbelb_007660 [Branchiostoma belcheri]
MSETAGVDHECLRAPFVHKESDRNETDFVSEGTQTDCRLFYGAVLKVYGLGTSSGRIEESQRSLPRGFPPGRREIMAGRDHVSPRRDVISVVLPHTRNLASVTTRDFAQATRFPNELVA